MRERVMIYSLKPKNKVQKISKVKWLDSERNKLVEEEKQEAKTRNLGKIKKNRKVWFLQN